MSGSIQRSSCANHPDRAAVGECGYCGKPVCQPCSVEFVATEQVFCSERCRDALAGQSGQESVSNATLEAGLKKPIRKGWALWARSTGRIALHILPIAVVAALIAGYLGWSIEGPMAPLPKAIAFTCILLVLLCAAFGVALVGVILSDRHAGLVEGAPYRETARRFIPWIVTWLMMAGITLAGYLALIIPGIYLGLRLFWADEFALIHNKSPLAALRASWELTREQAGAVFIFQFILGWAQYLVLLPGIFLAVFLMACLEAIGWGSEALPGIDTFILFLIGGVLYGALHGPEIVQFYGMRAAKSKLEAGSDPAAQGRTSNRLFAVVAILAAIIGIGFLAAIIAPNLINAIDRGKQMRTYNDSLEIATAMESFAEVNNQYPLAGSATELEQLLVPEYIQLLPVVDGWGRPFQVASTSIEYEIRSAGKDGVFETLPPRGATPGFDDDIVWRDGELVQWPDYFEFE